MSASSYIATHGLDPIPMSALTPSAKGSAETALGTTENATPQQAATDDEGFTFWDVLDIINPLQHIPGVSAIYREVTGDKIGDVARIAGATLFGGPIGLALAGADYALKEATGGHLDEHAVAMINGTTIDGSPIEEQGNSQLASAASYFPDDTGEASSNMLAYAHPTAWTANTTSGDSAPVSQVASTTAGGTPGATPAATVAVAAPSSSVAEAEMVVAAANSPTPNTALSQNAGRAFALDRKRDVRSPTLPVNPPRADAFTAINGSARSIRSSASAPSATPTVASSAAPSAPQTAMPLPLGMASQTATPAVPTAESNGVSAQPNQQAMARALQAQGLQSTSGSLPLGLFDQAPVQAPSVTPATAATSSNETAPQASRRQPQQQAELPAQAEPQTQASGPVQIPAWFDQAMQKAVANYERTGSLTGTPAAMPTQTKGTSS